MLKNIILKTITCVAATTLVVLACCLDTPELPMWVYPTFIISGLWIALFSIANS